MAKNNPLRFSTKYQDDESDLLYYGYRYYKASTGTWVSRDPIKENGGVNIYAFVQNTPLNAYDILGECDDDGTCGPDVTKPLNNVLAAVDTKFASWASIPNAQKTACDHLVNGNSGAGAAWDIRELFNIGMHQDLTGCDRQVTFAGRCYYASAVNYALFGRAMCNCHKAFPQAIYTLDAAIAGVIWHKTHSKGGYWGNEEAMQAVPFTAYGYNYSGSVPSGPLWFHFTCAPDNTPDSRVFGWRWRPLKPDWDN